MDDPLGLFDSDSTAFLDDLTDGNILTGGMDLNQPGMQQQQQPQQPQQQQYAPQQQYAGQMQNQVITAPKIQPQQQQQQFFDHDYNSGGAGADAGAAAMGTNSMQGMQGNMPNIAGNPQVVQQNMMSPNHAPQFGSPPPGSGAAVAAAVVAQCPQTSYSQQYTMQHQQAQPMWSQSSNPQDGSFQQQQQPPQPQPQPQPNQYMQQPQQPPPQPQMGGAAHYVEGQQQQQQQRFGSPTPQRHPIPQQYPGSPAMLQQQQIPRQPTFGGQIQGGPQMNGQIQQQPQQNFTYQQQQPINPQQINPQQQMMGQQQQRYPQQQQQQFQQQAGVYSVASNVAGGGMATTLSVASQQNGAGSGAMPQQNVPAKINQLQSQINQLYNMQQTPETQQQMLDLQEQVRTMRAQQQQIHLRQQQQQQQQQTFIIQSTAGPQPVQQQRPVTSIVIQRSQLRGLQPGQTLQIQRPGQQPQTIRIGAPPQHTTAIRMPLQQHQQQQQVIRGQQISPNQQVVQIQQQQRPQMVMQQPQPQAQQQPPTSVGQIIRVQQPGADGGLVQVQTLGGTTQLTGGQQVQQVRLVQISNGPQKQVQQAPSPRVQIVQPPRPQQQKVITVLVQKPGSQKSPTGSVGSNSVSPGSSQQHEVQVSMEIPSTVATTEEVETTSDANEKPKPKKKRPSKKRSAEQEKADKIIQEAIAKAKAEGREVPKVIETEDGQQIQVPQPKKKASPKKKKADADKKDKKAKEIKDVKPKPPPKPRPPKKKKTIPTFLKNKKRSKKAESDEDIKITPPTSPILDDAFKRRSSRNTKRKKYMDELDLDISDDEDDDGLEDTPLVKVSKGQHARQQQQQQPEEEIEVSIVEKIMGSRIGKRPKQKELVEQFDEVATKVEKIEAADTDENVDVDIMDESMDKPLPDPLATGNYVDPDEILADPLATGNYVDPNEILAEISSTKEKPAATEDDVKVDVTTQAKAGKSVKFASPNKTTPAADEEKQEMVEVEEFYVKYKNFSYLHCEWRTSEELELGDKRAGQKIKRYRLKGPNNPFDSMEEEYFNPDYVEVDRVMEKSETEDAATDEVVTHYLIKWRGLAYEDSTWEIEVDVEKSKIEEFLKWRDLPAEEEREYQHRPKPSEWKAHEQTPVYKNGNTLREYQLEGINWLSFCYHNKQNCILADEMGLGKTIQSITFLQDVYNMGVQGPYLVIVPLSTIGNWQREFEMWTDMNVIVYHGTQPSRNMLQQYEMYYKDDEGNVIPDVYRFQALVTTYEVIIQDVELLSQIDWRICIIDEAHRLKNQKCKLSEGLKVFDLEFRVLLTGTPLQNNVEELFALLHFLEPKQFNSVDAFMADFGTLTSETQVDKLKELLKPMMLRRLKEDVEKTLAPKEETIVEVELTNIQKKYYRAILERNFSFLTKTAAGNVPSLMNTMMELRKCCNHPFLINGAEEQIMIESGSKSEDGVNPMKAFQAMVQSSGKLVLIDKLLPKLKAGDHKVLIFSQMIRVLDIIEDYLIQKQYLYERIDGRIRGNLRQEAIDRFSKKDSDRFVFLLCTRAGGLGINLTAADTVIIYDSDWNPQNDLQAQARCHRIGQQKAVKIYRLITRNSYEREMFDKASLKLGLDKAVLQSMGTEKAANPNQMSKKEIEELLKKGAYGALMDDDKEGDEFCEEDIDQILQRRTQVIKLEAGEKGSTFAKASFSVSGNRTDIDLDDPNFWQKWAKKADIDVDELQGKNDLIMELPRQRKQTARYTYNDGDNEGMSELESSADNDSGDSGDGGGGGGGGGGREGGKRTSGRISKGGTGRRPGRRRRDEDDDGPLDGPFEYYTRADCFKVEKSLLVYGWGRWVDVLTHGKHRRRLQKPDVKLITRALLFYALQQYAGDERIKGFVYDLIAPRDGDADDDDERTYRNHSGLSAPVPRGRKGKKMVRGPGPSAQDEEMAGRMDIDPDTLLVDDGYKKHLKRHANKVLLRVRLLYYLRHEVIGEHADKIITGTPAHEIPIPTPTAEADPPAYWWNIECDRSLLVGVFKHGFEKYNLMRNDAALVFLQRCGPPDAALLTAEMNDEEIKNPSDDEGDADMPAKPKKRGRPGRKKASMITGVLDEDDEASAGGTPAKGSPQKPLVQAEEGKHPWPTVSDLNTRLRRIITSYQRNRKHEQMRMDQMAKKNEKRQKFEQVMQERERVRVESRQRWVRREEAEFYRVVSTFGVERDHTTGDFRWDQFRRLANLDKKFPDTLTMYFKAFYHMCLLVCRRFASEQESLPPNDIMVEPITEERASRCLARVDLLNKIREAVLWHPKLDERLKLCQPTTDMPDWWLPGLHDKELLIGAAKHGLGRTDFHIAFDSKLLFKEILNSKQAALIATTTQPEGSSSVIANSDVTIPTKPSVKAETAENVVKSEEAALPLDTATDSKALVKQEIKSEEEGVKMEVKEETKEDVEIEDVEMKDVNGEEKEAKSAEERTDVDTEEEGMPGKPFKQFAPQSQDTEEDTNMSMDNGAVDSSGEVTSRPVPATPAFTAATSVYWPKDRVILHRLEHVCHVVEHGEWPAPRRYRLVTDSAPDSRASTPAGAPPTVAGTPPVHADYTLLDSATTAADGLKMTFAKKKRGRRSRAEIEAERNVRYRELIQPPGLLAISDAESESNLSGYGGGAVENGVNSPLRGGGDDSCGGLEPGEYLLKKRLGGGGGGGGRKRKMDKFLEAAAGNGDNSPSRKRAAFASPSNALFVGDPETRITVISVDDGTRLAGEDAPKRKDLAMWLQKHPSYMVEGMEEPDTEDGEEDSLASMANMAGMAGLLQQQQQRAGPGRRRTRLDPAKLDLAEITGEENVAVVNRETSKRITGAKAPPLKHLVQWLDKNPAFDVDPKWSHIVKEKGKIPDDMQHRILVPHRRRTATGMSPSHAAASAAASSSSSASSIEYYTQLAQMSASNAPDPAVLAQYSKYLSQLTAAGAGSGAAAYSALATINPMYASAIQQYQSVLTQQHAVAASSSSSSTSKGKKDSKEPSKSKSSAGTSESSSSSSAARKKEEEAAEALSSMTAAAAAAAAGMGSPAAAPFMSYNPMMMNQYAQTMAAAAQNSQYAALVSMMQQQQQQQQQNGFGGGGGEEPATPPAPKKQRVRDNSVARPSSSSSAAAAATATASATITSSSSSKPAAATETGMDLTVKKSDSSKPKAAATEATSGKKGKKGFTLENIVQDLSLKKVKPQSSTESGGEDAS